MGKMAGGWMALLRSRKFRVAAITVAVLVLNEVLGWDLDLEEVIGIVTLALGYILGTAYEDGQEKRALAANGPPEPPVAP